MRPYNTTAVGSVIFYDCQPGFLPSNTSSMCGEDEMWSPDPSQVTCEMMTPTTGRLVVESLFQYFWKPLGIEMALDLVNVCRFIILINFV